MSRNELIISNKIPIEDILSKKIDYIVRIGDKNRWSPGTIFDLKSSHTSPPVTQIKILSSERVIASQLPISILTRCGYATQAKFKQQWEDWYQSWDIFYDAWLIKFELYVPLKDNDCSDMLA